jgi:hypothetical protein
VKILAITIRLLTDADAAFPPENTVNFCYHPFGITQIFIPS